MAYLCALLRSEEIPCWILDMSLLFKKPEKKLDSFLVPLRDKKNNKIRIRITDDIVMQKILKVKDQNAHVIQCIINDITLQETIKQYDKDVFDHVLENCNAWFQTDLSEEKIIQMFLPSINEQSEIKTLVSSIIEPTVFLDNIMMNSFSEVIPIMESKKTLTDIRIVLELEAQGIYIRSRKFGIRWLVKSIRMFQDDIHPVENLFDASTCNDIISSYKDDMNELEYSIEMEIDDLRNKIRYLQDYAHRARGLLDELENTKKKIHEGGEFSKEWAKKSDVFNKLVWNYQRDRLAEK